MSYQSIQVDSNSIHNLSNSMIADGKELINSLALAKEEILKFDECFNTPSGMMFKEKMIEYIESKIKFIQDNYLEYAVTIEGIANAYEETKDSNETSIDKLKGE